MRMRVAGSHHGAAVLEDLNVIDGVKTTQFAILADPGAHDAFDFLRLHGAKGEIVPRRKADYTAESRFPLRDNQAHPIGINTLMIGVRLQRSKVVFEHESG